MQINAIVSTDSRTAANAAAATSTATNFDSYLNTDDNSLASIFQKAADTYGVSVSLLTAMAKQESNFQADATSKSGAMGIMQLMPATASYLGCNNPYDATDNIMAGAKYISQLLEKYNGDTSLALAAYNAGSGNVDKYGGIPPFKETQDYVAKITANMNEGVTLPDGTAVAASSSSSNASAVSALTNKLLETLDSVSLKDILDQLFSYEDYLKFINLFIQNLNGLSSASDKTEMDSASSDAAPENASTVSSAKKSIQVTVTSSASKPDATESPDNYAYQSINYNNSVLNLLSQNRSDSN